MCVASHALYIAKRISYSEFEYYSHILRQSGHNIGVRVGWWNTHAYGEKAK
jgi:hypothetical protein